MTNRLTKTNQHISHKLHAHWPCFTSPVMLFISGLDWTFRQLHPNLNSFNEHVLISCQLYFEHFLQIHWINLSKKCTHVLLQIMFQFWNCWCGFLKWHFLKLNDILEENGLSKALVSTIPDVSFCLTRRHTWIYRRGDHLLRTARFLFRFFFSKPARIQSMFLSTWNIQKENSWKGSVFGSCAFLPLV